MKKVKMGKILMAAGILALSGSIAFAQKSKQATGKMPPPMEECIGEPVVYTGNIVPSTDFYDAGLPHAVGAQHYQVFRANRREPVGDNKVGWTYNHQPYLAYWNNKFYLQFLSGEYQEHGPPTCIMLVTSENGKDWTFPEILFPPYALPEIKGEDYVIPAGTFSVMHQRMGFYTTSKGVLLASGFYGYSATNRHSPNAGNGLGRVVREIKEDGTYGPVYFIRYNRHAGWNESNTTLPFYTDSKDKKFVKACEELLDNKLVNLQWWEEDRARDGFYVIDPADVSGATFFDANVVTSQGAGKALSTYTRPDGITVALWKNQFSALSDDKGKSWTPIAKNKSLLTTGAKTWGQRTDDGKYAIVYNYSITRRNRFPMVALVGEDGHEFPDVVCLNGEVAPMRYHGIHKNYGTQYFRGISEWNGNPPGNEAWFVYSMNKEDIWITRARTPITSVASEQVDQNFDGLSSVMDLDHWNLYIPKWAPIDLAPDGKGGKALRLKDEEPYDYCLAERVIPSTAKLSISFRFNLEQTARGHYVEFEAQDQKGTRPMKLRFDESLISFDVKKGEFADPVPLKQNEWYDLRLDLDADAGIYDLFLNGKLVRNDVPFQQEVEGIERILFRTSYYRNNVDSRYDTEAMMNPGGFDSEDAPGSEEKRVESTFLIDDILTK